MCIIHYIRYQQRHDQRGHRRELYDMSKWERKKSTYTGAYTFLSIIGDVVTYQTHVVG